MLTFFLFLLKNCFDFLSRYLSFVLIFFGFLFIAFICFSFFFSSFLFFVLFFLLFFSLMSFPFTFLFFFAFSPLPFLFSSFFFFRDAFLLSHHLSFSSSSFLILLILFARLFLLSSFFHASSLPFSLCHINLPGHCVKYYRFPRLLFYFSHVSFTLISVLFHSFFFLSIDTFIHLLTCLLDCSFRLALETLPFCTHPVNTEWRLPSYLQLKTK